MEVIKNSKLDTESRVPSKYLRLCEIAGLRRPGQHAKVLGGKYTNHIGEIISINWSDGEILMRRPKSGKYPMIEGERWWPLTMCQIMDPDYGPLPPRHLPAAVQTASDPPSRPPAPSPVSQPQPTVSKLQSAPKPWMPARKA